MYQNAIVIGYFVVWRCVWMTTGTDDPQYGISAIGRPMPATPNSCHPMVLASFICAYLSWDSEHIRSVREAIEAIPV